MKTVAIFGASGHGKVVADLAEVCGFGVVFFDEAYPKQTNIEHWQVLGGFADLIAKEDEYPCAIVAIGNNKVRVKLANQLADAGIELMTLVHPSAVVSQYAAIGKGTVVFANAVINAFAQVGDNVIINTGAVVEHDCVVASGSHVSPNAALAGGVVVGGCSWIGIGAAVRQFVRIGEYTVIGANSAVINDIPQQVTAVGVPAKVIHSEQ